MVDWSLQKFTRVNTFRCSRFVWPYDFCMILRLHALWLTYERNGKLYAYPFCPHMDPDRIRVNGQLGVSGISETQMRVPNPHQADLNSIVEALQLDSPQ